MLNVPKRNTPPLPGPLLHKNRGGEGASRVLARDIPSPRDATRRGGEGVSRVRARCFPSPGDAGAGRGLGRAAGKHMGDKAGKDMGNTFVMQWQQHIRPSWPRRFRQLDVGCFLFAKHWSLIIEFTGSSIPQTSMMMLR